MSNYLRTNSSRQPGAHTYRRGSLSSQTSTDSYLNSGTRSSYSASGADQSYSKSRWTCQPSPLPRRPRPDSSPTAARRTDLGGDSDISTEANSMTETSRNSEDQSDKTQRPRVRDSTALCMSEIIARPAVAVGRSLLRANHEAKEVVQGLHMGCSSGVDATRRILRNERESYRQAEFQANKKRLWPEVLDYVECLAYVEMMYYFFDKEVRSGKDRHKWSGKQTCYSQLNDFLKSYVWLKAIEGKRESHVKDPDIAELYHAMQDGWSCGRAWAKVYSAMHNTPKFRDPHGPQKNIEFITGNAKSILQILEKHAYLEGMHDELLRNPLKAKSREIAVYRYVKNCSIIAGLKTRLKEAFGSRQPNLKDLQARLTKAEAGSRLYGRRLMNQERSGTGPRRWTTCMDRMNVGRRLVRGVRKRVQNPTSVVDILDAVLGEFETEADDSDGDSYYSYGSSSYSSERP